MIDLIRRLVPDRLMGVVREARVTFHRIAGSEPRIDVDRPVSLALFGEPAYGWCVPVGVVEPDWVVVDVGIGEDVSFSRALADEFGCAVHCVDPTPRALDYLDRLDDPRLVVHPVGLDAHTGTTTFHLPTNEAHVSATATPQAHTRGGGELEVEMVDALDLRSRVGGRIDVLKLDIEGAEYSVLNSPAFAEVARDVSILCAEFHHRWPGIDKGSTERAVARLRELGFDCVWRNRATNEEYTFMRRATVPFC